MYVKLNSNYGTITHYYHFFYGVLVPLILYHLKHKETNFIITDNLGPMLKILYEIPLSILFKCETPQKFTKIIPLDNFRSKYFFRKETNKMSYEDKIKICNFFKVNVPEYIKCNKSYDIVLIERGSDPKYKLLNYSKDHPLLQKLGTKSGSERRAIRNHREICLELEKDYGDKFKNIVLENTSIYYQYHIFSNAKLIIAQHGAALANVIFMKDFNNVLEIIPKEKLDLEGEDSFKNLSIMAKLNYYSIETKENNPIINIKTLKIIIDKLLYMTDYKSRIL
jgi:hypothetical protein